MNDYQFIVTVTADDSETADRIMAERINFDEEYPDLGDPDYSIGYRTTDSFDRHALADAEQERADVVFREQVAIRELARQKAAAAQDLNALPSGRIYLDHEGDPWYKDPNGDWVYDPNAWYTPGQVLVERPWSDEQVRASGPYTPKEN